MQIPKKNVMEKINSPKWYRLYNLELFFVLRLVTAAAAAATIAGAARGGAADALLAVFLGLHHITDGKAQNHSHDGNDDQIFHNLFLTFQGLCLGHFLIGLGNEAQDDEDEEEEA